MVLSYLFDNSNVSFDAQLLDDIKQKDNEKVQSILQNAKDLYKAVDASGASLLHYAAEFGNEIITSFLIKSGSEVNLQNKDGNTSLLLATKEQHAATIKVLIESNADMNICDKEGNNALQVALHAYSMNVEIAKLLLDQLSKDCSFDGVKIAKRLTKINCPLDVAVLLKNDKVITCMLSECYSIEAKDPITGKTALHVVVENLDEERVRLLLNLGANVNAKDTLNKTPLAMLNNFDDSAGKSLRILKVLLDAKAEMTSCDDDGLMQIHSILKNGSPEAVRTMLAYVSDISTITDESKQNVLHYLATNFNAEMVKMIEKMGILKKVDINTRDENGWTPLHCAMNCGNRNFVEYLIEKNAILNSEDDKGVTPFLQAIEATDESTREKRLQCVKSLAKVMENLDILLGQYFKFHNTKSEIHRDIDFLKPIVAMMATWKINEEEMSKKIWDQIKLYPDLKQYFDFCTSELNKMKATNGYNISLCDYIVRRVDDRTWAPWSTVSNKSVALGICWKINKYQSTFESIPIYREILKKNLRDMAMVRMKDLIYFAVLYLIYPLFAVLFHKSVARDTICEWIITILFVFPLYVFLSADID